MAKEPWEEDIYDKGEKELKEKMDELSFDTSYAQRYVNEGFSGGGRQ